MKKRLLCCVAVVLALLLIGCNKKTVSDSDQLLLLTLHNSEPFINEQKETVLLKDYKIGDNNNIAIAPEKYAFIDFDKDGTNELIVSASADHGTYIIFRCNDQKVYGYVFDARALTDIKEDGTFMQSEGAGINTYAKLSFDENGYIITEEATVNTPEGIYKIGEETVTGERIQTFADQWNAKNNIYWKNVV